MAQDTSFTIEDLKDVMRACAGATESFESAHDISDITFEELGYDSLAVLETAAKLENQLGVVIPDDDASYLLTPRSLVDYVNDRLAA